MDNSPFNKQTIRYDLQWIARWIPEGSSVLGLGCGNGDLLYHLKTKKNIACMGIDQDEKSVAQCIKKGLSVIQGDINSEVEDYAENTFDYVILAQTLQQIFSPETLIEAMLRIGNKAIVTFPNFSHWQNRLQLLLKGCAPVSHQLPYQWYDTPNIRVITLADFRAFTQKNSIRILKEMAVKTKKVNHMGSIVKFLPNLRATYGLFLIEKIS